MSGCHFRMFSEVPHSLADHDRWSLRFLVSRTAWSDLLTLLFDSARCAISTVSPTGQGEEVLRSFEEK